MNRPVSRATIELEAALADLQDGPQIQPCEGPDCDGCRRVASRAASRSARAALTRARGEVALPVFGPPFACEPSQVDVHAAIRRRLLEGE